MKSIYLVRHAEASPPDGRRPDRDRPLSPRGESDAARLGRRWAQQHGRPDVILASPARRTLATAAALGEAFGVGPCDVVVDERLYEASLETLFDLVEGLDDRHARVMLVAHNPGVSDLARHFAREAASLMPCALVAMHFEVPGWAGLVDARPVQVLVDVPTAPA
jgi:phosphohistidine phosphatase